MKDFRDACVHAKCAFSTPQCRKYLHRPIYVVCMCQVLLFSIEIMRSKYELVIQKSFDHPAVNHKIVNHYEIYKVYIKLNASMPYENNCVCIDKI